MACFWLSVVRIFLWSIVVASSSAIEHGIFASPVCLLKYPENNSDLQIFIQHLEKSLTTIVPIAFTRSEGADFVMTAEISLGQPKKIQLTLKRKDFWNSNDALFKEYVFHNQPDLIAIANQWGDLLIEKTLGFKGALSYPLAYVEVSQDQIYQIILSDLAIDLRTTLYSALNPIISLAWSPDAHLLAFVEIHPEGPALKILNIQSLQVHTLEDACFVCSPSFSKDGRFLYYLSGNNIESKIIKYNIHSQLKEVLVEHQGWFIDVQTSWDDYHLLISSNRTGTFQIYEYNILNKKFKRLTFSPYECVNGLLNASNDSLFYSLLTQGHSLLMRRSFSDHQTHYVTIEGEAEGITIPPVPHIIAFERTDYAQNGKKIIVFKSLLSGKETLLDCTNDCYNPCWAPQPGIMGWI